MTSLVSLLTSRTVRTVSGPHYAFIPLAATDLPPGTDLTAILHSVAIDHVYAPVKDKPQLEHIVAQANARGIDLSIVVVPEDPVEADLRDLATAVAKQQHDTVLVIGPHTVGTYSDVYPRVRLEAAEDGAKNLNGQSVVSAQHFVDTLSVPPRISWTLVTGVVIAATALAVVGLWFVKSRRARAAQH